MKKLFIMLLCIVFCSFGVYAAEQTAEWSFDTDGDLEGWSFASAAVKAGRTSQSDGVIRYTTSEGEYSWMDNYILTTTNFSADEFAGIEVVMKHDFKDTGVDLEKYGYIYFHYSGVTSSGTVFNRDNAHVITVKLDDNSGGEYLTHYFDFTDAKDFAGSTITSIMFKPLFDDGSWEIDCIRLVEKEVSSENDMIWTFNTDGDTEGWSFAGAAVNAGRTSQSDGAIRYTTTDGAYSWLANYILAKTSFSANKYKGIELVMKHDFKDTGVNLDAYGYAQFFYSGTTAAGISFERDEAHCVDVKLTDNSDGEFVAHYFDLTEAKDWLGSTISSIMFKPLLDDGSWEIDEIRLLAADGADIVLDPTLLTLSYEFEDDVKGNADGTISIDFGGQNSLGAQNITLNWATSNGDGAYSPLSDYIALKTTDGTEMEAGYTFDKDLLIPEGADALMAYITNGTATFSIGCDIPVSKQLSDRGEPLYTAAFISDIHAGGWGSTNEPNSRLLAAREQINELADFVVANGDLTQWFGAYSGESFLNYHVNGSYVNNGNTSTDESQLIVGKSQWLVLEEYFKGFNVPVYAVQGNHDVRDSDKWNEICCGDKYWIQFLKDWISYSNETEGVQKYPEVIKRDESVNYYDTEINGHHYIFLEIPRNTSPYYSFGEEQLAWLDKMLFEKEASGKPIFVFGHVPVETELSGGYWDYQLVSSGSDAALKEIFAKHPTVIYTTGHTHYSLDVNFKSSINGAQSAPSYINDGGITTVQTPNSETSAAEDSTEISSSSHGVIAEVYEDCVVIRGRDFVNDKWIPRGHTIITFKNQSPVKRPDVYKITDKDNGLVTITAFSDTDAAYTWYLDGAAQADSGNTVTVPDSYTGYIAVRVTDKDGNYVSEMFNDLGCITEAGEFDYVVESVYFTGENGEAADAFGAGNSYSMKVNLKALKENAGDGYIVAVTADRDGRPLGFRIIPVTGDTLSYDANVSNGETEAAEIKIYTLGRFLKPLSPVKTIVSEN